MDALVIGGTGTLGRALIPKLLHADYNVTVLSREELKQKQLKHDFPEVKCVLGDIRDYDSVAEACLGKTVVFHLAAMKHVDTAEDNLDECVKINLLGTQNVARACLNGNVGVAVFSSTDKAVLPVNAYGMAKALSEKIWLSHNKKDITHFSVFRWGNVIGSRGSVVHSFLKTLRDEKKIYITNMDMTRFWIHVNDVAKFMYENFDYGPKDAVKIPAMKAASIISVAHAVARFAGLAEYQVVETGVRAGEKMHEWLDYHDPDMEIKSDTCPKYTSEELDELVARCLGDTK